MNLRGLKASIGLAAVLASGCVVNVVNRNAYDNCTPGDTCAGATYCTQTNVTGPGLGGSFCSNSCTPGAAACVGFNSVCVASVTGGSGVCHQQCATTAGCPVGQSCSVIAGTGTQVCVPGTGGSITPTTRAYVSCTPAGSTCSDGTTCIAALAQGPTTPQGNTCTQICSSGLASSCPSFVPGSVECVNLTGNPSMFQCVRLCNSASDCTPYNTQCLQVTTGGGAQLRICAP